MGDSEPRSQQVSRRRFIGTGSAGMLAAGLGGSLLGAEQPAAASTIPAAPPGAREALRLLREGNCRWVSGRPVHPHQSVAWRHHVVGHQNPFATVISCIDSRVPPELVFDRGLGDLFVVRTGAQTLDEGVVLGSIEFGPVNYAPARLMLVLGHQRCGAVEAAIKVIESGGRAPGHIQAVVNALRPAYRLAVRQHGDLVDNMTRAQTRLAVQRLRLDPPLRKLIAHDGLVIVGGHYLLDSGVVQLLD
jgi:carbonic anhydrase